MSDARRKAKEAIVLVNECCDATDRDCVRTLLSAVRALLAEEPEAPARHVIECNNQSGPIGAPGFLCIVVNRNLCPPPADAATGEGRNG